MHRYPVVLCLLSMALANAAYAQTASNEPEDQPQIDPVALEVLENYAAYLGAAQQFAFAAETNYDAVQDSGVVVEFGASRRVLVSRPNRMRMESQRRDGLETLSIFDGEAIWVYTPNENAYATTAQPGSIDDAIDFAVSTLRLKAPLVDLISPDLYKTVTGQLKRAQYLGETVVAGVRCEHLLLSNDYADFQIWIATGNEPLPRRVVITYREEPGRPQFRAQFLEWTLTPEDVDEQFKFAPPGDAEQIRFYLDSPAEDAARGDQS